MVEKISERRVSPIELMRTVSSNFDDNLILSGSADVAITSGGLPISIWEEKARLLNGIRVTFVSGTLSSSDILEQQNMQLRNENLILRDTIRGIQERLASIEASLPREKVIVLRELSEKEAENEIKKLFSSGKTLYYSDIAQQLRLDLELVVNICNKLQEQGEITIDAGVS